MKREQCGTSAFMFRPYANGSKLGHLTCRQVTGGPDHPEFCEPCWRRDKFRHMCSELNDLVLILPIYYAYLAPEEAGRVITSFGNRTKAGAEILYKRLPQLDGRVLMIATVQQFTVYNKSSDGKPIIWGQPMPCVPEAIEALVRQFSHQPKRAAKLGRVSGKLWTEPRKRKRVEGWVVVPISNDQERTIRELYLKMGVGGDGAYSDTPEQRRLVLEMLSHDRDSLELAKDFGSKSPIYAVCMS